jgi:hypothetical protein
MLDEGAQHFFIKIKGHTALKRMKLNMAPASARARLLTGSRSVINCNVHGAAIWTRPEHSTLSARARTVKTSPLKLLLW